MPNNRFFTIRWDRDTAKMIRELRTLRNFKSFAELFRTAIRELWERAQHPNLYSE